MSLRKFDLVADEECLEKLFSSLLSMESSILIVLDIVPEQKCRCPEIAVRPI
jgi:hypothetical protein